MRLEDFSGRGDLSRHEIFLLFKQHICFGLKLFLETEIPALGVRDNLVDFITGRNQGGLQFSASGFRQRRFRSAATRLLLR